MVRHTHAPRIRTPLRVVKSEGYRLQYCFVREKFVKNVQKPTVFGPPECRYRSGFQNDGKSFEIRLTRGSFLLSTNATDVIEAATVYYMLYSFGFCRDRTKTARVQIRRRVFIFGNVRVIVGNARRNYGKIENRVELPTPTCRRTYSGHFLGTKTRFKIVRLFF